MSEIEAHSDPASDEKGQWRIRLMETTLGQSPVPPYTRYGHTFIQVLSAEGQPALEIHGYHKDRTTGEPRHDGSGGALAVMVTRGRWDMFPADKTHFIKNIDVGSLEALSPKVETLLAGARVIDAENHDYSGWGIFSPGQNCNTVARALSRLIGQDIGEQPTESVSGNYTTGSGRVLPIPVLDAIVGADGAVDASRLAEALQKFANNTQKTIAMPSVEGVTECDPSAKVECRPAAPYLKTYAPQ